MASLYLIEPKRRTKQKNYNALQSIHRENFQENLLLFEKKKRNHPLITIVVPKKLSHRDEKCAPIRNPFHCRIFPVGCLKYWPYGRNTLVHPFKPLFTAPAIHHLFLFSGLENPNCWPKYCKFQVLGELTKEQVCKYSTKSVNTLQYVNLSRRDIPCL